MTFDRNEDSDKFEDGRDLLFSVMFSIACYRILNLMLSVRT